MKNELIPLNILKTDEDLYGHNVFEMTNFYRGYLASLSCNLEKNAIEIIKDLPIADISILENTLKLGEIAKNGEFVFIPDFNKLPKNIIKKLKEGVYSIGESRKDAGNFRAVIMDENNSRIRDITFKKIKNDAQTSQTINNMMNQLQLKQIADSIETIKEMQSYQIDFQRDQAITVPFFDARDFIVKAQNADNYLDQKSYLEKASEKLSSAMNAIQADMNDLIKHLSKSTSRPIFRNQQAIKEYSQYLAIDISYFNKFVGLQAQILDNLRKTNDTKQLVKMYNNTMKDFCTKSINNKNESGMLLLHNNFPYNKDNNNNWNHLRKELLAIVSNEEQIENEQAYMIDMEEPNERD